jgi:hypothetical protein
LAEMSPEARKVFEHQYDVMIQCGVIPDVTMLRAYAIARAEFDEAQKQIDTVGAVVRVGGTNGVGGSVRESPYVGIRDRALEAIERLGVRLGLDNLPPLPPERRQYHRTGGAADLPPEGEIAAALEQSNGVVTHAAAILNVERHLLQRRISESASLQAHISDMEHRSIDWARATIRKAVARGDTKVAMWLLETKDGYTRKLGIAGPNGQGPLQVATLDMTKYTDEQLAELEHLLSLGQPLALPAPDQGREGETVTGGEQGAV